MHLILISLLGFWLRIDTEIPNFYPSYTSAREVAKQHQKETLVFFSRKSCGNCFTAWQAFEMDKTATQNYISTRMDADDFDGTILFEKYELNDVPAWVVLAPDGSLKEKWEGGWKDTAGQPTIYAKSESTKSESKQSSPAIHQPQAKMPETTPSSSTELMVTLPAVTNPSKTSPIETPTKTEVASSTPSSSDVSDHAVSYVLQAGYFGSEANAQKLVTDLAGKGFNYFTIQPTQQNGSTFYRVISKSFNSETDAKQENELLTTKGFKTTVRS